MAAISFRPGFTLENLPKATTRQLIDRQELVSRIAEMRSQWADATGGDLARVTLDLGLLFDDLVNLVGGYDHLQESVCIRHDKEIAGRLTIKAEKLIEGE
jgi:hypothetical protein